MPLALLRRYQRAISSGVLPASGAPRRIRIERMKSAAKASPAIPAARGARRSRPTFPRGPAGAAGSTGESTVTPSGGGDGAFRRVRGGELVLFGFVCKRDHNGADKREGESDHGDDDVPGRAAEALVEDE